MERYLLFDGGCTLCTGLAQDIERATNGWLTARSLREVAVRELLDKARPGWTWEPTLVEVDGERVRVFTGVKLRSRLVVGLGPKRAVRVAQLVQQALAPKAEVDHGRRTFLQRGAMLAGLLVVGPRVGLSPPAAVAQEQPAEVIILGGKEAAALVKEAKQDPTVKQLTKWLVQTNKTTKGWRERTAVPFTYKAREGTVSAVALVDAATSGILIYGQGWTSAAILPTPNAPTKVFGIKDGSVQEVPPDQLPSAEDSSKVNYTLFHKAQPSGAVSTLQRDCCTVCVQCLAGNTICSLAFACCFLGGPVVGGLCCVAVFGSCLPTIAICAGQFGCNCFGAC